MTASNEIKTLEITKLEKGTIERRFIRISKKVNVYRYDREDSETELEFSQNFESCEEAQIAMTDRIEQACSMNWKHIEEKEVDRVSDFITDANEIGAIINHFTVHELSNANRTKYGRAIQKLIKAGARFKIEVCEAGRSYKFSEKYRSSIIVHVGDKKRTLLIKDMSQSRSSASIEEIAANPQKYRIHEDYKDGGCYYKKDHDSCFTMCSKDTEGAIEHRQVLRNFCLQVDWRRIAAHLFFACKGMITSEKRTCAKCNGEGRISAFMHVENGICFDCWGTGGDIVLTEEFKKTLEEI